MITQLVTTAIIEIIFVVVMKKRGFAAPRAGWMFARFGCFGRLIRRKLMAALSAEIFLVAVGSFTITVKFCGIVAFWT